MQGEILEIKVIYPRYNGLEKHCSIYVNLKSQFKQHCHSVQQFVGQTKMTSIAFGFKNVQKRYLYSHLHYIEVSIKMLHMRDT